MGPPTDRERSPDPGCSDQIWTVPRQCTPYMADMNVDRAWLDDSSLAPYCVDEVLPAPDNFRLLNERFK